MKRSLDTLEEERFDLLILGGGITGAGVALDASLRGFRVALIDKGDFASGTSSVSSKLIHGGLRYLEHAEFHLVYEALQERRWLLENAWPFVRPLSFLMPFYRGARLPPWKARAGLVLYDLLAGSSNLYRSRPLALQELRGRFPDLRGDSLLGGAEFHDAQMDDARLCLTVLRSAVLQGAHIANYMEAVGFEKREGKIIGVRAQDRVGSRELLIRAHAVLNATGPWVDATRALADARNHSSLITHHSSLLQPTKGVHVIVPQRKMPSALLLLHPADGRVFFVIPWMHKTLIGTTDTITDESPDHLKVASAEIDYLLQGFNHYCTPPLQASDVQGTFAGLRPLMRQVERGGAPSSLSREYRIHEDPSGLISVAGGKFTTFRRMAETITDAVARRLGRRGRCRTRDFRLDGALSPGSDSIPEMIRDLRQASLRLSEEAARHLVWRYGSRARNVIPYLDQDSESNLEHRKKEIETAESFLPSCIPYERIIPDEPDLRGELLYQRDYEMAIFPADFWLRRTRLGLFHPDLLSKDDADLSK